MVLIMTFIDLTLHQQWRCGIRPDAISQVECQRTDLSQRLFDQFLYIFVRNVLFVHLRFFRLTLVDFSGHAGIFIPFPLVATWLWFEEPRELGKQIKSLLPQEAKLKQHKTQAAKDSLGSSLVGGFKYFTFFTPKIGEDFQFDEYFSNGLKPDQIFLRINFVNFTGYGHVWLDWNEFLFPIVYKKVISKNLADFE